MFSLYYVQWFSFDSGKRIDAFLTSLNFIREYGLVMDYSFSLVYSLMKRNITC